MEEIPRQQYVMLKEQLYQIRNLTYELDNPLIMIKSALSKSIIVNDEIYEEDFFNELRGDLNSINNDITFVLIPEINTKL